MKRERNAPAASKHLPGYILTGRHRHPKLAKSIILFLPILKIQCVKCLRILQAIYQTLREATCAVHLIRLQTRGSLSYRCRQ